MRNTYVVTVEDEQSKQVILTKSQAERLGRLMYDSRIQDRGMVAAMTWDRVSVVNRKKWQAAAVALVTELLNDPTYLPNLPLAPASVSTPSQNRGVLNLHASMVSPVDDATKMRVVFDRKIAVFVEEMIKIATAHGRLPEYMTRPESVLNFDRYDMVDVASELLEFAKDGDRASLPSVSDLKKYFNLNYDSWLKNDLNQEDAIRIATELLIRSLMTS